jgi:hypothetical protein
VVVGVSPTGGSYIPGYGTATVSDPAVVATGGFTIQATEGSSTGTVTVATFVDPGAAAVNGNNYSGDAGLAQYQATINPIFRTLSHDGHGEGR